MKKLRLYALILFAFARLREFFSRGSDISEEGPLQIYYCQNCSGATIMLFSSEPRR